MVGECRIPGHITGLYVFAVVNLFVLLNVSLVSADVIVIDLDTNSTIKTFDDMQAQFGPDFPEDGLIGRLIYVNPHNACKPVDPPPIDNSSNYVWIALIAREKCSFAEKVFNVQKQSYSAAIVHNYEGNDSIMHMGPDDQFGNRVTIPSVFVGYDDGMKLARFFNATKKNFLIKIKEYVPSFSVGEYLWPMAIVVGCCFLLMIIFLIAKWVKGIIHRRRTRLSARALKKIPTKKFKKGDHYDVCAICLEDYVEGEKLRVLPCDHAFHTKCVDPWLTKRKKTCPCCKRRVIPGSDENDSDSENENDVEAPNENTPLLRNSASSTSHGLANTAAPSTSERDAESDGHQGDVFVSVRRSGRGRRSRGHRNRQEEGSEQVTPIPEEGAVGGISISDQMSDENQTLVETHESSTSSNAAAAAIVSSDVVGEDSNRSSPARLEGSINAGFSSSEDDSTGGNGRGQGRKKKQFNQVV